MPIWLRDRETIHKKCTARLPLARKLAKHFHAGLLRVSGTGSWMRLATGSWLMRSFDIKDFDVLDDSPLAEVIKQLHGIEGADWGEDPIGDLTRLRTGEGPS